MAPHNIFHGSKHMVELTLIETKTFNNLEGRLFY